MIYVVADKLGGTNGGDQHANDVLLCLRQTGRAVTVISREGRPGEGDDRHTPPIMSFGRPRYVSFPKRPDRQLLKRLAK